MVWSWDQGQQGYTEDSYAVEVDYNFTQSLLSLLIHSAVSTFI